MHNRNPGMYVGAAMAIAPACLVAGAAAPVRAGPTAKQIEHSKLGWEEDTRYHGSKGKQAKPAKRPNMRHVSRRTKRRHRRAA